MNRLIVDQEKCKKDGICAAECPMQIISITDRSFPAIRASAEDRCINCGHCVAVCPQGALALTTMKPEACPPVQKELLLSEAQVRHLVWSRRSIRSYKEKQVDGGILEDLIRTARYAPTGSNLQPVHWTVVKEPTQVNRLAGLVVEWMQPMLDGRAEPAYPLVRLRPIVQAWQKGRDMICRGAPHMIVAHGPKELYASLPACIIALTTLELIAPSFGLGACWAGYFNAAINAHFPLFQALGLPEDHQSFGAMMIGYPKYQYHRIPLRNDPPIAWR